MFAALVGDNSLLSCPLFDIVMTQGTTECVGVDVASAPWELSVCISETQDTHMASLLSPDVTTRAGVDGDVAHAKAFCCINCILDITLSHVVTVTACRLALSSSSIIVGVGGA